MPLISATKRIYDRRFVPKEVNGVGTTVAPGNINARNVDLLIEKKLAGGWVPTLEGEYYWYGLGAPDCGTLEPGSVACPSTGSGSNVGGLVAGKAYMGTVALMFPEKMGWASCKPFIRYQHLNRELSSTTTKATDIGVNYLNQGL